MIIYRITGKCEAFKGCGMIHTEPQSGTGKAAVIKRAKKASEKADKAGMKYTFIVHKLTLKKFDQALALVLLGAEGCVEDLIEDRDTVAAFASKDIPEAKLMPEAPPKNDTLENPPHDAEELQKYIDDLPF